MSGGIGLHLEDGIRDRSCTRTVLCLKQLPLLLGYTDIKLVAVAGIEPVLHLMRMKCAITIPRNKSLVVMLGLEPRLGTDLVLPVYKAGDACITLHDH